MYEVRWTILIDQKWTTQKTNTKIFYDLKQAIDFLNCKKEKIKKENWISGKVVETRYICHLEI